MRMLAGAAASAVVMQLASAGHAAAQVTDGLRIAVVGFGVAANGGERIRVKAEASAANIGTTESLTILHSRARGCVNGVGRTDYLGDALERTVGPDGEMRAVDSAWVVEVTPLSVAGDAATFRLRWVRARDNGRPSTQPSGNMELTLRVGQSIPLDFLTGPPPSGSGEPCVRSLRVSVERAPAPEQDRRLLTVDMWLVDRMPDGTERSQALSLRGLYGQPIPFYFDRLSQAAISLDLFGDVQVTRGGDGGVATISLKGRIIDPTSAMPRFDYVATTSVTTPLVEGEVVSVALPEIGQGSRPALTGHTLSLRIRFHQIR
jgi:hypothetical protein